MIPTTHENNKTERNRESQTITQIKEATDQTKKWKRKGKQ